tara:strand:+ start:128 stop:322 length:195 start_codon:yes stop_codon:yes gene_type:complete
MPPVQDIIDYENGEMKFDRIVEMFQTLINTGYAWSLQGHYGRTAQSLIDDGYCTYPEQEQNNEQ